jgi:hypothetical protein
MRKKLNDAEKKPKISITIDKDLDIILTDYLKRNNLKRSRYIEKLIKDDIKKKVQLS